MRHLRTVIGLFSTACLAPSTEVGAATQHADRHDAVKVTPDVLGSSQQGQGFVNDAAAPFVPPSATMAPEGHHAAAFQSTHGQLRDDTAQGKSGTADSVERGVIAKQSTDTHGTGSMPEQVVV
jgi:hypothetical protein